MNKTQTERDSGGVEIDRGTRSHPKEGKRVTPRAPNPKQRRALGGAGRFGDSPVTVRRPSSPSPSISGEGQSRLLALALGGGLREGEEMAAAAVLALLTVSALAGAAAGGDIVHHDDEAPKIPGCSNDFILVR